MQHKVCLTNVFSCLAAGLQQGKMRSVEAGGICYGSNRLAV
jgi:hypothetical protein